MPPFLNYELSPTATDTGLIVPGDASGTTSGSSTFGNGLSTNQNFNQPILNTVSDPLLTHGGVPKPPLVDVHGEATRLLGQENIGGYLRDFYKKPQNEVFQDLVNGAVSKTGKTFETAGIFGFFTATPAVITSGANFIKSDLFSDGNNVTNNKSAIDHNM